LRRFFLVVVISLFAVPLWAGYGLSNVVTQQLTGSNQTPAQQVPAQNMKTAPVQPTSQAPVQAASPVPDKIPAPAQTSVQAPAVDKQPAVPEFKKTVFYPYTIHISSWQNRKEALKDYEKKYRKLESVFITKIDLGETGIWYRIDYGAFNNVSEAMGKMKELKESGIISDPDAFIGAAAPYAIEIGVFGSGDEAQAQSNKLQGKGLIPYVMKESGNVYRVLSGAYPNEKSALPARQDLKSMGLQAKIAKR
jgi:septal ring-binding cell division protein DamX